MTRRGLFGLTVGGVLAAMGVKARPACSDTLACKLEEGKWGQPLGTAIDPEWTLGEVRIITGEYHVRYTHYNPGGQG